MLTLRIASSSIQIVLADAVVKLLTRHRQRFLWQSEQGGLLFADPLGCSRCEVIISQATPPHSRDRPSRHGLRLDPSRCSAEVSTANESGLVFVGYWHTHPEATPEISGQDVSSFYENLRQGGHGLSRLLAVIVGQRTESAGIAGYLVAGGDTERLIAVAPTDKAQATFTK